MELGLGSRLPLRPVLSRFAGEMEKKLRANDHKGGWENDTLGSLMKRVREEWREAEDAISTFWAHRTTASTPTEIAESFELARAELADVANFCMMLSDRMQKHLCRTLAGDEVEIQEGDIQ